MSQTYTQNLEALSKINPILAEKIDSLEVTADDFEVVPAKTDQDHTLKIIEDDKERLVHSLYQPHLQAEKRINKLELGYHNLIGVAGLGCGHYIRALLQQFSPESQVVVIENKPDILKEVMKQQDLTDILQQTRNIKIFDGSDEEYITRMKNQLRRIDYVALTAGNVDFFKTPVLAEIEADKYIKFRERFFSTLQFINRTMGNDPGDSIQGIEHIFANLNHILNSINLEKINQYNNKPALCVASGPSLDKNIDVLEEYQDKFLIITADTVLKKLLDYGITPDIVGVLERGEAVYNYFFKDLIAKNKLPEEVVLAAEGVIHPKIYDDFPGKKLTILRNNIPSESWFAENTVGTTGMNTGNSVANLNFSIAHALGCSPIVLAGQDLAFAPDGKIHTSDTKYEEVGEQEIKDSEIVKVKDYNGNKIKSKKWWKVFKEWFEYRIAETGVNCIDATEGGAYIEGTKLMSLQEVVDKYCQGKVDDINRSINSVGKDKIDRRIDSFEQGISEEIDKFVEIKEKIEEIVDLLETARQELDSVDNTEEWVKEKFSQINTEIAQISGLDGVFFFVCQAIFIQLERNKVKLGDLSINSKEKFADWCSYDLEKLDKIKQICDILIDVFTVGQENIKEIKSIGSDL